MQITAASPYSPTGRFFIALALDELVDELGWIEKDTLYLSRTR